MHPNKLKLLPLKEDEMPKGFDYEYKRGRRDREYDDQPYYRGDEESYNRRYDAEPSQYGSYRGGYYNEPYRGRRSGEYYSEPYESPESYRDEYSDRSREPYYRREYERGYREPYDRGRSGRSAEERGFFERAGDEVKSWFGDKEAERRRRMDEVRKGMYVGRGPRGYQRSEERIREDINDRLTEDWYVDASDIEVTVNNGMVTLTGLVNSREEKRRAEDIVESVSGVSDVSNQLRIGRSVPLTTEAELDEEKRSRTART
jgi:osmotically-inducible protein OsmY